mmetsp:Transcript_42963/g.89743  ORF Transcript_42963/g.89743 Transcript_42963/m.89743 type:complete len:286 (+) Transcript_42963:1744-2601(+)
MRAKSAESTPTRVCVLPVPGGPCSSLKPMPVPAALWMAASCDSLYMLDSACINVSDQPSSSNSSARRCDGRSEPNEELALLFQHARPSPGRTSGCVPGGVLGMKRAFSSQSGLAVCAAIAALTRSPVSREPSRTNSNAHSTKLLPSSLSLLKRMSASWRMSNHTPSRVAPEEATASMDAPMGSASDRSHAWRSLLLWRPPPPPPPAASASTSRRSSMSSPLICSSLPVLLVQEHNTLASRILPDSPAPSPIGSSSGCTRITRTPVTKVFALELAFALAFALALTE